MMVWILTSSFNDYDQHGEYFIAAFGHKPTPFQLQEAVAKENYHINNEEAEHILNGGGRRNSEYCWFYLREHNV